jgi:multidrug efflux pump subunit AcrA (membrane-fusion protein)
MGHKRDYGTLAVLGRFLRRYWKAPSQTAGSAALLVSIMGFTFLNPPKKHATPPAPPDGTVKGVVESTRRKGVGTVFEGRIRSVDVTRGTVVKSGQVLFSMETSPIDQRLKDARQQLSIAKTDLARMHADRAAELRSYRSQIAGLEAQLRRRQAETVGTGEELTLIEDGGGLRLAAQEQPLADAGALEQIRANMRQVSREMAARAQEWNDPLAFAVAAVRSASADVARLSRIRAQAVRRAPISGVVTGVFTRPGEQVSVGDPLVRIDDPDGYRIVSFVDRRARETVKAGTRVTANDAGAAVPVELERVENGVDRELFRYYLWFKPVKTRGLEPGEQVAVKLPTPK